jgi:hypothetical protein
LERTVVLGRRPREGSVRMDPYREIRATRHKAWLAIPWGWGPSW